MFSANRAGPRHQCFLHSGAAPLQLSGLAAIMHRKLQQNHRCVYLDHPHAIAALRPCLGAAGIHVEREVLEKRLLLISDPQHLADGHFDLDRMMRRIERALARALEEGYDGLWASGDLAWEMGPRMDYSGVLEYERRLETFIARNPAFTTICRYRVGTLSRQAVHHGLLTHPSIFFSENLSMINPYFLGCDAPLDGAAHPVLLDAAVGRLCER